MPSDPDTTSQPKHAAPRKGWAYSVYENQPPDRWDASEPRRVTVPTPVLRFDTPEARDAHAALVDEVERLNGVYESAVNGRQEFRQALREARAERDATRQERDSLRRMLDNLEVEHEKACEHVVSTRGALSAMAALLTEAPE